MELWIIAVLILVVLYGIRNLPPVLYLRKKYSEWQKERAKQKKLDAMYARLDHEGDSKFHKVQNIRMMNQVRKGKK
jgi:hypothetical protein